MPHNNQPDTSTLAEITTVKALNQTNAGAPVVLARIHASEDWIRDL